MDTYKEVKAQPLPPASLATLERLRNESCSESSKDFHLQSFQIFLRRKLSPESPNRNMLLFHGTGTGKTCSAIQVAEEYILRPEYQDKKVIVLAGRAVQSSFRNQIFDVTRLDEQNGVILSQQCTGRRYLDMLQRAQKERIRVSDADSRESLNKTIQGLVDDFYEFTPYQTFANQVETISIKEGDKGIQREFNNRLIIIDEAHALRTGDESEKLVSAQIETIVKKAKGVTLVLLTATPMFDTFEEILYYFNLFLWNDGKQAPTQRVKVDDIFKKDGDWASPAAETQFRGWCQEYVSFIRGENPFTFPFRLPPPDGLIAPADRQTTPRGEPITNPRRFLPLVGSTVQSPQKEYIEHAIGSVRNDMIYTLVVSPIQGKKLLDCFTKGSNEQRFLYQYAPNIPKFLAPSQLAKHAAKFETVLKCIKEGSGVVFVYSNFVRGGIEPFAMALEEAGFEPYSGPRMLENPAGEVAPGSAGRYIVLTESNIDRVLPVLRSRRNVSGEQIKVVLGSPFTAEGVDFRYVRQVHVLDPWDNISKIDQIIGRGLRTCSHAALPFRQQNCTVYLHVCRLPDSTQESLDEYVYRERVEAKAQKISFIKRVLQESSVDCSLQLFTNQLPLDWQNLMIPQERSQDGETVTKRLSEFSAPTFEEGSTPLVCHPHAVPPDTTYQRPLSSYLDIKDELFNTFIKLFKDKPIWEREELLTHPDMIADKTAVQYSLQLAETTGLRIQDSQGRTGLLESKGPLVAFKPMDTAERATLVERLIPADKLVKGSERIEVEEKKEDEGVVAPNVTLNLEQMRTAYPWKFGMKDTFGTPVLDWYLVDSTIPKETKQTFLLSLPREGEMPPYANGLVIPGLGYMVLGTEQVYDTKNEKVTLVGREKDAFEEWITGHMESIVQAVKNEDKIVCTMGDNKAGQSVIKFAAFSKEGDAIKREKREKTIKPKDCMFFTVPELQTFAKSIKEPGFPEGVSGKDSMCTYLGGLVREAALAGNPLVTWILPEVLSVLSEEPYKTTLRKKLA